MEIKDVLSSRRKELGMTMKELAVKVGVSEGTISRWESGKISDMRRDKIMTLATALDISPAVIMGWMDYDPVPHPDLTPISKKRLPLYDGIACGEPRLVPDGIELYVDVTTDIHADFVLKCHGDSMTGARIHDGDLVIDDGIRVIRHSVGHDVLALKQVDIMVVGADINDRVCNLFVHKNLLFSIFPAAFAAFAHTRLF